MINFSEIKLVKLKKPHDNFVGIRKSKAGDRFEFCLPNGFQEFPEGDYDEVRDLFFKMYRTFRKFECDNQNTKRVQKNTPEYQQEQDQTIRSSGGISITTEEGDTCILYSKIKMIEQVLEAYDDLAINSIQNKIRRTEEIDYSQIHKYLDSAIYLDNDVIYIDAMNLPRPILRYDSTDIVNLYCYILNEIVQQLEEDVPDNIQEHRQDISFRSQAFKDDYLTSNQSIFDKDTFVETINILKEALDHINNNTYYKDADYWGLYEAIETFLYGELNPAQNDGEFWGIKGFSLVWEDMCHTYFFKQEYNKICFADTDIPLKNHQNPNRQSEEKNRVGNNLLYTWIYCTKSHIAYPNKDGCFGWNEFLCIEFDTQPGTLIYSNRRYDKFNERDRSKATRRFPSPDLVLKEDTEHYLELSIIDYKDVPIEFYYQNLNVPIEYANEKYRIDTIKQLTYELALQQTHKVKISNNWFLIPYYSTEKFRHDVFKTTDLKIKGISIVKADFYILLQYYLGEN